MKHTARDARWIALQVGLLVMCCCLAAGTRRLVGTGLLSDATSVALQVATTLVLVAAAVVAVVTLRRALSVAGRVAVRTAPVGFLLVAASFVTASYADVSISLRSMTAPGSDGTDALVTLGPNGQDIRLSGSLYEGVSRKVADLLAAHPEVTRIHLTSDGGLVDEGEALRKLVAAHHLTTFVPDYCVSACTLAFIGGRERLVMEGARLGFHGPYEEGLFDQLFPGDSRAERATYLAAGLAADFVDRALKVTPSEIWTPGTDRLLSAHVATGVVDRYRFPDSNLDGSVSVAGARATLLRNFPLARALDGWNASAVDDVAAWYLAAFRRGLSEGEIVDGLTWIFKGGASLAMAEADDETLVALGRFVSDAMALAESDEDCVSLGLSASLIDAETALNQDDENADDRAVALLTQALATRHAGHLRSVPPQQRPVPTQIALSGTGHSCAEVRGFYAAALRLPPHDAASLLRALVATLPQDPPPALAPISGSLH